MSEEIQDFMDLAKPIHFKVSGKRYVIPSFNEAQFSKLMEIGSKFAKHDDNDDVDNEERLKRNKESLSVQAEYIEVAISEMIDGELNSISRETIISWPLKVRSKIIDKIQEQMKVNEETEPTKK